MLITGSFNRRAVSSSWIVKPKAPSPVGLNTGRPGCSHCSASAYGSPNRAGSCRDRGSTCACRAPASGRCSRKWCGRSRRPPARRRGSLTDRVRERCGVHDRGGLAGHLGEPGVVGGTNAAQGASQSGSMAGRSAGSAASRSSSASRAPACIATACSAGLPSADGSMLTLTSAWRRRARGPCSSHNQDENRQPTATMASACWNARFTASPAISRRGR